MKKIFLLILFTLIATNLVYAGNTSLPFESALTTISNSLSGPVAKSIGIGAFAVAGLMYVFAPELNGIVKMLMAICVALGIIFGAQTMIDILFKPSSSGNVIVISNSDNKILSDKIFYEQDI